MTDTTIQIITNIVLGILLVWLHRKIVLTQSLSNALTLKVFLVNEITGYRHSVNLTFQAAGYVNCSHGLMTYEAYQEIERKAIKDIMLEKMQDITVREVNEQLNQWYK